MFGSVEEPLRFWSTPDPALRGIWHFQILIRLKSTVHFVQASPVKYCKEIEFCLILYSVILV